MLLFRLLMCGELTTIHVKVLFETVKDAWECRVDGTRTGYSYAAPHVAAAFDLTISSHTRVSSSV